MPPIPDEQTAPGPSVRESLDAAHLAMTNDAPAAPEGGQARNGDTLSPDDAAALAASADAARARDEQGRFAKPGDPPHTPVSETASTAAPEPHTPETIRPPASLPAALKAEFATLPPAWQKAIADIEGSVGTAKAEWGKKGERLNRLDEVLAPRKDQLATAGVSEVDYVKQLVAADEWLRTDAPAALNYLARSYGVDLRLLAQQATGGQAPQQGAQPDPNLAPLYQQIQTLTQTVTQQQQNAHAARMADVNTEIEQFSSDPKNLYFADVAEEMGRLLDTGRADTLAKAYEMATWADPEIRPLLLKAQQTPAPDPQALARAKATDAAKAAGSVTGAPGSASPGTVTGSKGSVRADLEHAAAMLGSRVG